MGTILRRLRGTVGNALLWGTAWFGIGLAIHTITGIFSGGRFFWPYEFFIAVHMAKFIGGSGALIGAGFSVFIAANFRHQRVETLSPWRFALGGGLVTALISLVLLLTWGSWIWPFDLPVLIGSMGTYSVIGGATAFGTIKLTQHGTAIERHEAGFEELPGRSHQETSLTSVSS